MIDYRFVEERDFRGNEYAVCSLCKFQVMPRTLIYKGIIWNGEFYHPWCAFELMVEKYETLEVANDQLAKTILEDCIKNDQKDIEYEKKAKKSGSKTSA